MWAEFQLPFPPLRPVAPAQLATPLPRGVQEQRQRAARHRSAWRNSSMIPTRPFPEWTSADIPSCSTRAVSNQCPELDTSDPTPTRGKGLERTRIFKYTRRT
jgi:hypothetical protein